MLKYPLRQTLTYPLMGPLQIGAGGGSNPPVNTVAPVISGSFFVGQTLSTTDGTWTGDAVITFTYQWQNAGVNIGGATNNTYVLVAGDDGDSIRCVVTGTNGVGAASANSNAVIAIQTVLWLDAADTGTILSSSNLVSQWNDKSGNGYNATQETGARQPATSVRTLNSKNVIDFTLDGQTDSMVIASGIHSVFSGNFSVFVVFQADTFGNFNRLLGVQSQFSIVASTSFNRWNFYNNSTFTNQAIVSGRDTNPHIFYYKKSTTTLRAASGGVFGTDGTGAAVSPTLVPIGSSSDDPYDGAVAEIIIYSRALSDSEANDVGQYLSAKWGITWTDV